jgi:hypothetical protein
VARTFVSKSSSISKTIGGPDICIKISIYTVLFRLGSYVSALNTHQGPVAVVAVLVVQSLV